MYYIQCVYFPKSAHEQDAVQGQFFFMQSLTELNSEIYF